jgi:hypothetical protein
LMRVDWKRLCFVNQQELHLTTSICCCQQRFSMYLLEAYAATFVILPFQDISCQASFRGFLSPGTAIFTTPPQRLT